MTVGTLCIHNEYRTRCQICAEVRVEELKDQAQRISVAHLRALRDLREGENVSSQESNVRRHLKALESAGLVRVTGVRPFFPYRTSEGDQVLLHASEHAGVED